MASTRAKQGGIVAGVVVMAVAMMLVGMSTLMSKAKPTAKTFAAEPMDVASDTAPLLVMPEGVDSETTVSYRDANDGGLDDQLDDVHERLLRIESLVREDRATQ